MKLNDVYTKPLKDVVEELNLTDMKVHTDDDGEVRSIELNMSRTIASRKELSHDIKGNRSQGRSGIQTGPGY